MNQYVVGNNLDIVKDIKCDLVYIDPPYNTGRDFGDYNDKWKYMKIYSEEFLYPRIKLCYDIINNNINRGLG